MNPIFARLESDFAEAMAQPIRTDIPRPVEPLPWLDDIEEGVTTCAEDSDDE